MEKLIIKRKEYDVISKLGERSFKVTRKGKEYFAKKYNLDELSDFKYYRNRLKSANIKLPEIKLIDKKNGFVLCEIVEGETIESILIRDRKLNEKIYEQIFRYAWFSKLNKIVPNFDPSLWVIFKDKLYYMDTFFEEYTEEKDFAKAGISLWFFTKYLVNHLKNKGIEINYINFKPEYEINKEMVLTSIKYYK